ncbi:MAG: hypothetical protein A3B23_01310 [Candidatus Colwellbacteria bacterium RIFCSPLOWO2_01_FULL_48_10]|uniref:Transcriptional repressor n=2 Tax=Bacteria candidate phyla TaxID=1783234 RepID=A0A1F5P1Y7_9BACT|nr:MAG: hypothetical protein A2846_05090 [Candidatus Doudnabacteria bacterium RIFCSPHIGHO2_01_FULL_49_9]OGY59574.1 MAG: hypothetical protein A3B23_01310 [Candidatus Colwellbacteria bacterium RIFCSPLOWO2_01_FULL_48_10]
MKNTKFTQELRGIFAASAKPLTVADILGILRLKKLRPNKTTIYRQLEKMTRAKDLEHVHFESRGLGYEKAREHHHHLICNSCEKIEDLVIKDEQKMFDRLLGRKEFKAQEHHLEIFGLCMACSR